MPTLEHFCRSRLLTSSALLTCTTALQAAPPPAPDVLTESTAHLWSAGASSATASVTNDSFARVGASSIKFTTNGGFDTWLRAPESMNAGWDLQAAGAGGISFWVYAQNPNIGFQSLSPWIRLHTSANHYVELHAATELLNAANGHWVRLSAPFQGDALWTVTTVGQPNLASINWIEIHADTWEFGFTLWIDGLEFDAQPTLPATPHLVVPILFVPDPASFPIGHQPTEAELDEDVANINLVMHRIQQWCGRALGLPTSLNIMPAVRLDGFGGLDDYEIEWTNPALQYTTGITLRNTWGTVLGEVSSRGYSPGTPQTPRLIVIFCKGSGGFAGGAQWHGASGGGMCMLGHWGLDSLAGRVPPEWVTWWTGVYRQTGATAHEMGHTLGLPHPDLNNPVTGQQDFPYSVMGAWWDWPVYLVNPAAPTWPLKGFHAWASNAGSQQTVGYMDDFLLAQRSAWFQDPLPPPGDANGNGTIDIDDLLAVITTWGACTILSNCVGDVNLDNRVNVDDLLLVITNWSP